ncbi:MAG: hypothetical protein AAGH89_18275 [Verrucomicrobiota bacterium]
MRALFFVCGFLLGASSLSAGEISRPIFTERLPLQGLEAIQAECERFASQAPSADGRFLDADDWPSQIRFTRLSKDYVTFQVRIDYGKSDDPEASVKRWAVRKTPPISSVNPAQFLNEQQIGFLRQWLESRSIVSSISYLEALGERGESLGQTSSLKFLVPDRGSDLFAVVEFLHTQVFKSEAQEFKVTRNDRRSR